MKNKPTKIRPPRVYRTKTGRPYIKHKGKKIYLNFGKKTNDMSTLNIIKLFLKYLTKKKRSTTTRRPKSVIEKPEQENREKVNMQIEKYLSDKYGRINEMDKIEEKKRREVKERAEEKKREDEAKARQELKDAEERKRDIDRAIERERKLQAELKADRAVSRTVLRQLTASNNRIDRLIEEGKNVARNLEERAIVEAIPIEGEPILEAIPIEDAPRRARRARIAAAPRRERKKGEQKGDRKRVEENGEQKGVEYRVIEDVTAISKAEEAKQKAEADAKKAEQAKQKAEVDAKIAIDNAAKNVKSAKEAQQKSEEDAKKAEQAKQKAEADAKIAIDDADKSKREYNRAKADAKKSNKEAADAEERAKKSNKEAADAQKLAEKSNKEAADAQKLAEKSNKEAKKANEELEEAVNELKIVREEADKYRKEAAENKEESKRAIGESKKAREETKKAVRDGIIESMFSAPIKSGDKTKVPPTDLVKFLQILDYDIKIVKQEGKKVNAKDTVKNFLKANPEKFELGDSAKTGWQNLLTQIKAELDAYTVAEATKLLEEEKLRGDSKEEAKQEGEDNPEEDAGDGDIEEVVEEEEPGAEQDGTGLRVLRDACINIIGELNVKDIKKFLKKTHMDAYRKKYRHKGKLLKFNYIEALMLAMANEKIRLAVCSKLSSQGRVKKLKQVGGGNEPKKGLTTTQLDDLMEDEKRYLGTVASDEIKTLKPNGTKYAFIMNTDKASKPGQHWIAVYISGKDDKTDEVYDPLGTYEPTKEFLEQIKTLVDKMKLDHYLLLKVNKITNQSDTSDTCGWFAVKFIKERFLGNRFKFSTGFTQLKEDEIQKYKKQNGYGFDTYL